jgi:hypothetical protein
MHELTLHFGATGSHKCAVRNTKHGGVPPAKQPATTGFHT